MEAIKDFTCSSESVLTLLIAWCFGAFLKGMAGFGTRPQAGGAPPVTPSWPASSPTACPPRSAPSASPPPPLASITIDAISRAAGLPVRHRLPHPHRDVGGRRHPRPQGRLARHRGLSFASEIYRTLHRPCPHRRGGCSLVITFAALSQLAPSQEHCLRGSLRRHQRDRGRTAPGARSSSSLLS